MKMNWKGFAGSGCGLILRYYPGISLKGLRKAAKTSVRITDNRHLIPGPPEYEVGVLTA
jgi:hypothetical protein